MMCKTELCLLVTTVLLVLITSSFMKFVETSITFYKLGFIFYTIETAIIGLKSHPNNSWITWLQENLKKKWRLRVES